MRRKEFIIVLIITLIVVVVWVLADTLHSKSSTSTDPKLQEVLDPIDGNFDQQAIQMLKNQPNAQINKPTQPEQ